MVLPLLLQLIILLNAQNIINPTDFLISKTVYGSSAVPYSSNSSTVIFFTFSGAVNSETSQSNIHKVSIKLTNPPFITSEPSRSEIFPTDRSFYGIFSYKSFIYVFGGLDAEEILDDLWKYDIEEDTWTELRGFQAEEKVEARYDFAFTQFTVENFTYFVVVGGIGADNSALSDCKMLRIGEGEVRIEDCFDYSVCTKMGLSGAQVKYYEGKLYLFSGVNLEKEDLEYFTGVCILDTKSLKNWERLNIDQELIPSNRGGSSIYNGQIFYFFGSSYSSTVQIYNPFVFSLNLTTPTTGWTQFLSNSTTGYDSFSYILHNDTVFVFGGIFSRGVSRALVQLSLSSNTQETFVFRSPSRRIGSAFIRSSTNLYIFGGQSEFFYHNSIWQYSPMISQENSQSRWDKHHGILPAPPARKYPASTSQGDFIIVAGGVSPTGIFFNDFWLLDTRVWSWTELVPNEDSERSAGFAHACVVLKVPYLYLIGGLNNQRVVMKDIWRYDFTKNSMIKMKNLTSEEFPEKFEFGCKYEKTRNWINGVKHVRQSVYVYFGRKNTMGSPDCTVGRVDIDKDGYVYQDLGRVGKMKCRTSAAYHYENNKLVVVGGKGFSGKAYKDIWMLSLNDTHVTSEEIVGTELYRPVYGSSYESFNRNLLMFSGFDTNGNTDATGATDLVYIVDLKPILKSNFCDIGFQNVNGTCEMCPIGSFASKIGSSCEKCEPIGTLTTTEGATAGIQCLIKQDYLPSELKPFIEKAIGFNFKEQDQAPIYQPPDLLLFYVIFGLVMVILVSGFLSSFVVFKDFASYFIRKNVLRRKKLRKRKVLPKLEDFEQPLLTDRSDSKANIREIARKSIEDELRKKELRRSKQIEMRANNQYTLRDYVGGFFTGMILIVLIGILIYLPIDYFYNNEKEKVELMPTATFRNQFKSLNNKLKINLITYPFNYGDCSVDLSHSDLKNVILNYRTVNYTKSENVSIPFACHIHLTVDKSDIYENDFISIKFQKKNVYAKNIFIWVEAESAKPGFISRYFLQVNSTKGKSIDGRAPTLFKFLMVPAYFQEEGYFLRGKNNSGIIVHSNAIPSIGSLTEDSHLAVGSSLSLKLALIASESSMLTSVYLQIGLVKFFSILSAELIGIFGIFEGIYILFQVIKRKCKRRRTVETLENEKHSQDEDSDEGDNKRS